MDAKGRKKLIDDLADPKKKNFEPTLSTGGQRWVVDKLIDLFNAAGQSDAMITFNVGDIVKKAKPIVAAEKDFAIALTADGNDRYTKRALAVMRKHRVEILYGAIAHDPFLVDAAKLPYVRFIAKRRFRSICRMYYWVNPNYQGYFRYPHTCKTPPPEPSGRFKNWRLNVDAKPFWESQNAPDTIPARMKMQPSGDRDPIASLGKLFLKKTEACEGNLLDCSTTASIVFMDALLEAKDPAKFLKKLATLANYLAVALVGTAGSFMADTTDEGVMRSRGVSPRNLQVGDHLYIFNHPLYKTFRPTGSWRGEHALVYISGDRNYRSQKGFVFGGHGKDGTLYQFYDAFVSELKSHLAVARQLMIAHLAFMRGGAAAIAPGTVIEQEHPIAIGGDPATVFRVLQYDKEVIARDFTKVPTRTTRRPGATQPGFLVLQSKSSDVFYLDEIEKPDEDKPLDKNLKKTIAEVFPPGKTTYPIKFSRLTPGTAGMPLNERYAPESWGVQYFDQATQNPVMWKFFEVVAGKVKRKELTLNDLFDSPFQLFNKKDALIFVREPKVDIGAAHQAFLAANGGI